MDAKQLCALLNEALKDDGANFVPHYRGAMWPMGEFRRSGNSSDEFVRTRDGAIVARIEDGKLRVRVDYPTEQDIGGHEFKPSDPVDSVNISLDKSPERIAADIRRRLLNQFREQLPDCIRQRDEHCAGEDARKSAMRKIGAALGENVDWIIESNRSAISSYQDGIREIRVEHGGYVSTVEISARLSSEKVIELAKWIKANREDES